MIKIAITGGIGSGKSVISQLLRVFSYPVYDADNEAKRLMSSSGIIKSALITLLGQEVYKGDVLDKTYMASIIFADKSLLQKVNEIVHPVVKEDFRKWCCRQKKDIVFLESAILFESGFETEVDYVWLISAPEELRIARAVKRDNSTVEQIERRIKAQWPEAEKIELSDAVIQNNGRCSLIAQVQTLLLSMSNSAK